jgi:hypothetical protein
MKNSSAPRAIHALARIALGVTILSAACVAGFWAFQSSGGIADAQAQIGPAYANLNISKERIEAQVPLAEAITWDPFTAQSELKFARNPPRLWSVGPDRIDDLGLILYDPSNGLTSSGDLVVPIDAGVDGEVDGGNP